VLGRGRRTTTPRRSPLGRGATIRDDGVGIEEWQKGARTDPRIMGYRAGLIGASQTIEPTEGDGTSVTDTLPEGNPDGR
jgi:nitrate/nitrite-specific signal transduction histidine kinase